MAIGEIFFEQGAARGVLSSPLAPTTPFFALPEVHEGGCFGLVWDFFLLLARQTDV